MAIPPSQFFSQATTPFLPGPAVASPLPHHEEERKQLEFMPPPEREEATRVPFSPPAQPLQQSGSGVRERAGHASGSSASRDALALMTDVAFSHQPTTLEGHIAKGVATKVQPSSPPLSDPSFPLSSLSLTPLRCWAMCMNEWEVRQVDSSALSFFAHTSLSPATKS